MPSFFYTARDPQGSFKTGRLDAVNEDEVLTVLQSRGLVVTTVTRGEGSQAQTVRRRARRRLHPWVTTSDLLLLCEQMSVLLEAGVPLLRCLETLSLQVESRPLMTVLEQIRRDIQGGRSLRDSMARHPKIFSNFFVSVVETGEASGHLASSFNHIARYLESAGNLQRKAVTAMIYPAILLLAVAAAIAVFLLYIIPIFQDFYASMEVQLPWLTRVVVACSLLVRRYALLVIPAGGALGYVAVRLLRTERGKWIRDHLMLRVPIFHRLFTQIQLAQFSRGLGAMLNSGVPILYSLEIMEKSATNKLYGKAVAEVRAAVREGSGMADPLEATDLFPPMMVQMVRVGEEIGDLAKMLHRMADYYEMKVNTFVERLAIMFEPIAVALVAVVVGTFVIAMYLPIFGLAGSMRA